MFKEYDQSKEYLIPPSIKEFLWETHEAVLLNDIIEQLDLSELYQSYNNQYWWTPAYNPKMLLKVIFYAYMTQTFSSRKIEKKLQSDLWYMYLSGKNTPNFRTINGFRKERLVNIWWIFNQVVKMLDKLGLVTFWTISIDGTKIYANASKSKNMTVDGIDDVIKGLLEEAERIDAEEDELYGENLDNRPKELSDPVLRKRRIKEMLDEMQEKKEFIEEEIKEKNDQWIKQKKINETDKDSRIMMMKKKDFANWYNVQIATENQFVLWTYVSSSANDVNELIPTLEKVKRFGKEIIKVRADKWYASTKNYKYLKDEWIDAYIPPPKKQSVNMTDYKYNKQEDTYKNKDWLEYRFKQYVWVQGSKRWRPKKWWKPKKWEYKAKNYMAITKAGKKKYLDVYEQRKDSYEEQKKKQNTEIWRKINRGRQWDVEVAFWNIKQNLWFTKFNLRGLKKVNIERNIISIAHNMRKMMLAT